MSAPDVRALSPLLQRGFDFLEAGDAAGAEVLLDAYVARNADDAHGHNILALTKRALGQTDAALSHMRRAAALAPREPVYAVNLAKLQADLGDSEGALATLDRLLQAVPGQADALIQRISLLQHLRRLPEATALARMAVAFHRDLSRTHYALGMSLLKEGRFADAVVSLTEAARLEPQGADIWINLGVAQKESGDFNAAEASYRHAIALTPDDAIVHNNLGNVLGVLGRTAEALDHQRKAVSLDPTYADAKANLGLALRETEGTETALTFLEKAVALHPDHVVLLNAYGNTLRQAERLDEAVAVLERAIAAGPNYAEAHNNLALAYALRQKLDDAARHFKRACELKPDSAVIANNYGALLLRMFRFDEAVAALSSAVAHKPDYDEALINLGVAYYMRGDADDAIAVYRRVLARTPDNGFARYSLGVAYLEDQRLAEAEVEIRAALALDPKNAMAHNTLGVLMLDQHFVAEARTAMREAADVGTMSAPVFYSNYAFASLYAPGVGNDEIFAIHKEYGRRFATAAPDHARPHANARDPKRKLRVAYLSPDFRAHSVAYFFEPLLEKHDRSQFEIALYSDTTRIDVVTKSMRAAADLWVETAGLTDEAFVQRLVDDRIDILVNLGGHTSGNRLPVCALRPAPVQIEYLGYPETSGVPAQGFRLTDLRADPPGAEGRCTEELVRLPSCFHCYRPAGMDLAPAPAPHVAKGYVTFASFNVLPKVTDEAIGAWSAILKALPNARFLIKCKQLRDERVQGRIRDVFARNGVDPARVDMAAFMPSVQEHLSQYGRVDLALDTFPYNGTTTTCESLYMGVPVLTIAGDNHRGRVGLSLLHALGLADRFVAKDVDDYIAKAVAWGREPKPLADIRATLRPAMQRSPLCDEVGFTRELERTYRALWQRWCEGPATTMLKPAPQLRPEDSIQGVLVKTL